MDQRQDAQSTLAADVVVLEDTQLNQIGMAVHEANRVWCEINGDNTKLPWGVSQGHLRASTRRGVAALVVKLNDGEMPDPEESHENWCVDKLANGWKFDDTYSPENKKHPNLVPWADLSEFERAKDTIFMDVVVTLYNGLQAVQLHKRQQAHPQDVAVEPHPPNEAPPLNTGDGYGGEVAGGPPPNEPDDAQSNNNNPVGASSNPQDVAKCEAPPPVQQEPPGTQTHQPCA